MRVTDAAAASLGQGARTAVTGNLARDLAARQAEGRPIRIGLIGSGEMGTDIVTQCRQMTGITVAAIPDLNIEAARRALRIAGIADAAVAASGSASAVDYALKAARIAITENARAV